MCREEEETDSVFYTWENLLFNTKSATMESTLIKVLKYVACVEATF